MESSKKIADPLMGEQFKRPGPFGHPDAARGFADDEFLNIDGIIASPRVDPDAMRKRIIVGRKGSGKSLYLRWHRRAAEERGLIVLSEAQNLSTNLIATIDLVAIRDAELVTKRGLERYISQSSYIINFWSQVWERALYLSIASIALTSDGVFTASQRERTLEKYKALFLSDMQNQRSVCNFVQVIHHEISKYKDTALTWRRYLDHPDWALLRSDLTIWCERLKPISLYVDAIDDDFEDAPQIWLHCQGGLFKSAFESLYRDERLSNRVHLIIAVRDISFSYIAQSEHGTRYAGDPKIQHLQWDVVPIREFLHKKIQQLPEARIADPSCDAISEPFKHWLSFDQVVNKRRHIVERVSDYIIRHTRMLPRDIVIVGNAICDRMEQRVREGKSLNDNPLRQKISEAAKYLAGEAMRLCITELIMSADYMSEIIRQDWPANAEGAEALDVLKQKLWDKARYFFRVIECEVVSKQRMHDALLKSGLATNVHLSSESAIFRFDNLLWRHGLLAAYVRQGERLRWKFHGRGIFSDPTIDPDAQLYGFHSALIDLYGLDTAPEGPVF